MDISCGDSTTFVFGSMCTFNLTEFGVETCNISRLLDIYSTPGKYQKDPIGVKYTANTLGLLRNQPSFPVSPRWSKSFLRQPQKDAGYSCRCNTGLRFAETMDYTLIVGCYYLSTGKSLYSITIICSRATLCIARSLLS